MKEVENMEYQILLEQEECKTHAETIKNQSSINEDQTTQIVFQKKMIQKFEYNYN
jgi:hypothetical protein